MRKFVVIIPVNTTFEKVLTLEEKIRQMGNFEIYLEGSPAHHQLNGPTVVIARDIVHVNNTILRLDEFGNSDQENKKRTIYNVLANQKPKIVRGKDFWGLLVDDAKLVTTQKYPECTVPISLRKPLFLQVSKAGILFTRGIRFLDAPFGEVTNKHLQIWKDGKKYYVNVTSVPEISPLGNTVYVIERANNPFGCRMYPVNEEQVPENVVFKSYEEIITYENGKVGNFDKDSFKFETILTPDGRKYYAPRILIETLLGVEVWRDSM